MLACAPKKKRKEKRQGTGKGPPSAAHDFGWGHRNGGRTASAANGMTPKEALEERRQQPKKKREAQREPAQRASRVRRPRGDALQGKRKKADRLIRRWVRARKSGSVYEQKKEQRGERYEAPGRRARASDPPHFRPEARYRPRRRTDLLGGQIGEQRRGKPSKESPAERPATPP